MTKTLESLTKNLIYISETDAPVEPVKFGKASAVLKSEVLSATGNGQTAPVEIVDAEKFFERLTTIRDWFGPRETEMARGFAELKKQIDEELTEVKVFKIGKIEIDIYVVGLDRDGNLAGVKTRAIET